MKQTLPSLPRAALLSVFMLFCHWVQGQILVQDFNLLPSLEAWANASNPDHSQVNTLVNKDKVYFELGAEAGDQYLRLVKAISGQHNQVASFYRNTNFPAQGLLQIQFDMTVNSAPGDKGTIGSFYIGERLEGQPLYPAWDNRFATININFEGGNQFSIINIRKDDQQVKSKDYTGEARITIVLNNTAAAASYLGPDGEMAAVGAQKLTVWVNSEQAILNADAHAAAGVEMKALKFSSRNNGLEGVLDLDNLVVEPLKMRTQKPQLSSAGGTYTVGTGGDFSSITNPGGVFEVLNALQGSITGAFTFRIVSDLLRETGQVSLNEISGTSTANTISFQPQDNTRVYAVSGENSAGQGAMIDLNGVDWVVFDGRVAGDASEGIDASCHLVLRNAGTAPTIQLQNNATHNRIAYTNIQGASNAETAGVIYMGNGGASGNDANSFLYNRIGGYGQQHPLNALVSTNTSESFTEDILIRGNQFYGFGHAATLSLQMPCALLAGEGSSRWQVLENHFFQEAAAGPITAAGAFAIQGVCINAGTDHLLQGNFVGGTGAGATGDFLSVSASGNPGSYPSIIPFKVDAADGVVNISGNTVRKIMVTGLPFVLCDALALGSLAIAGEVNFTDNTFGDPQNNNTAELIARTSGEANTNMGAYMVAPIYYKAVPGKQLKGTVVGNNIGAVQLEGSFEGTGKADLKFIGILTNSSAEVTQIKDNTIANISASATGNIGVSLTGIYSSGIGAASIERNVLYRFFNNAPSSTLGCVGNAPSQDPAVTGLIIDNQQGTGAGQGSDVLVANNMVAFEATDALASGYAVYNGILVPANNTGKVKVYHNTVYLWGVDNRAVGRNFVFYRKGSAPTIVRNNIFLNTRQTNKPNFIMGSASGGLESDYNLIFQKEGSSLRDFGFYGPGGIPDDSNDATRFAETCEEWKNISGQDQNSLCINMENFFVDPGAGNLRILQTQDNPVVDKGSGVDEVKTDIDLMLRIQADIGASEAYNAWIGVVSTSWFDGRNWSAGVVPTCQEYNLLTVLPTGTELPKHLASNRAVERVSHQPVVNSTPQAVYRNLLVQEGASLTIGSPEAHLAQCEALNPEQEGIYNAGSIIYTAAGRLSLKGVLKNDGTIQAPMGTFILAGAATQQIHSTTALTFWDLNIAGGGRKLLSTSVLIKHAFQLESGVLESSQSNSLTLDIDAVVDGTPTDAAHVAGPLTKRFSGVGEEFVYPLGDEGSLGLMALQTSEAEASQYPVSFTAAYFVREENGDNDLPPADLLHEDVLELSDFDVWQVSMENGGMANAHIALYYHDQTGIEDVEDAEVVRWEASDPGPGWTMAGESRLEDGIPTGYGPRLLSEPQQTFTYYTLGIRETNEGLPVTLVNFSAAVDGQDVQLSWGTVMEKNSSHFLVQRSMDGSSFRTIGQVGAAGNSQESLNYTFVDKGVGKQQAGSIYYRLEQVDFDGTTAYSPLVAAKFFDHAFAITGVYPNPFADQLSLQLIGSKSQQLEICLLNLEGRQVYRQKIIIKGSETLTPLLNVEQLQAGMYILEVRSAEQSHRFKVIKR